MPDTRVVTMRYRNHRGEVGIRRILPEKIEFRSSPWHPTAQWILVARDLEKNAERDFALKDVLEWNVPETL